MTEIDRSVTLFIFNSPDKRFNWAYIKRKKVKEDIVWNENYFSWRVSTQL